MTQNAYSIFEEPKNGNRWSDYHLFAPVSPKIVLLTRITMLSTGIEENDKATRQMYKAHKMRYLNPSNAGSYLEDLPVGIAANNFATVVNGKAVLKPTRIARHKHAFKFPLFALSTAHVQRVNTIFRERAMGTKGIVYKSATVFKRAPEYYLADNRESFNTVPRIPPALAMLVPEDGRWQQGWGTYPELLEQIVQDEFGSPQKARFEVVDPVRLSSH